MWSKPLDLNVYPETAKIRGRRFSSTMMKTFTDREVRLIRKLRTAPSQTTLELRDPCPSHSACIPLPLFRVYRTGESTFQAEWNSHHRPGPKQEFLFEDVLGSEFPADAGTKPV